MKKLTVFLSAILIISFGCQTGKKQTIDKDGFSITLPATMFNAKGQMLDSALLEYADTANNLFVIVEEKKDPVAQNNLDSARSHLVDYFLSDDALPETYKLTKLKNGQMVEVETAQLAPDYSSLQTYWVVGIFPAGQDDYFVVWSWTDRGFKPDNEKTLKTIIKSFKINRK